MKNIFAAIGIVGTVVLIVGCGLAALILGNIALDVNRTPVVLENGLATIEAADLQNTVRVVGVEDVPVVVEAATAVPAQGQPAPSPTPYFAPAAEFSPQFLADCALAQNTSGRRVSPRCPSNAAEMLGGGR